MPAFAQILTHILFLYTLIAEPLLGVRFYRSLQAHLEVEPRARGSYFLRLFIWEWSLAAAVTVVAALASVPLAKLGLRGLDEPGWVLVGTMVMTMALVQLVLLRSARGRDVFQQRLKVAEALLPTGKFERWLYATLSLSAGICEELLFRGYLWWYLATWTPGLPEWGFYLITSAMFGFGHLYQGGWAVLQTTLTGAILAFLYRYTGSLIPAMVFHALVDLRVLQIAPIHSAAGPNNGL